MAAQAITITIKVAPRAHQRLHEMAKPKGYTPTAYAQLLFDAAFAARIGQERADPVSDAELDEHVRLVFALAGQADAAAIARATGVPKSRVTQILDGFRQVTRGRR